MAEGKIPVKKDWKNKSKESKNKTANKQENKVPEENNVILSKDGTVNQSQKGKRKPDIDIESLKRKVKKKQVRIIKNIFK